MEVFTRAPPLQNGHAPSWRAVMDAMSMSELPPFQIAGSFAWSRPENEKLQELSLRLAVTYLSIPGQFESYTWILTVASSTYSSFQGRTA